MSLKDIIEQGSSFKIDAENDFNNDPSWINDSNLDKYQQWEHCTSMYLKDKYPNNETYIKFSELTGNNRIDILDKQLNLLKALLSLKVSLIISMILSRKHPKDTIIEIAFSL